jgi:hypothetical protein
MPDRTYTTVRYPPKARDRLMAHFGEALVASLGILLGMTHIVTPYAQLSLERMSPVMSYALSALMVGGGGLWIFAILYQFKTANSYWLWLRFGLSFSAFSWFSYFIAAVGMRPQTVTVWLTHLVVSMIPIGLWFISFASEKSVRKTRRG